MDEPSGQPVIGSERGGFDANRRRFGARLRCFGHARALLSEQRQHARRCPLTVFSSCFTLPEGKRVIFPRFVSPGAIEQVLWLKLLIPKRFGAFTRCFSAAINTIQPRIGAVRYESVSGGINDLYTQTYLADAANFLGGDVLSSSEAMHKPIKYFEKAVTVGANAAWKIFDGLNQISQNPSFTPKWSEKPLLKSYEKTKPPLGWPRETDSLCPRCIPEIRQKIVDGEVDYKILLNQPVGEIKAKIIERDGKILMVKECSIHGQFEDLMSIDPAFSKHLEDVFPGRDIRAHSDETLHNHGTSTITHGRGSVLTIDLTNRCNMMCDPCFMDANQVGFVHELSWEDIQQLLDNAISIKPRRQMSVQFSGGEPTLSPYFLDAVRYARKVGYNSVQAATNGIEFAKRPDFCKEAAEAGLRYAYLQFDGIGNAANSHRAVGNLFDVKLRAIENLWSNGVDIVPVITIINGVNNEQVGRVVQFALDNPKKIPFLSFQPVSFTGRDEAVTEERRQAQRYTLSHLAHDVKNQTGIGEPVRDWFPISFMSTFSDFADLVHGPAADWGQLSCGCHPNCGIGMAVMCDKETKEHVPVTAFLHADQLAKGHCPDQRCGARTHAVRPGRKPCSAAQLQSVQGSDALQIERLDR